MAKPKPIRRNLPSGRGDFPRDLLHIQDFRGKSQLAERRRDPRGAGQALRPLRASENHRKAEFPVRDRVFDRRTAEVHEGGQGNPPEGAQKRLAFAFGKLFEVTGRKPSISTTICWPRRWAEETGRSTRPCSSGRRLRIRLTARRSLTKLIKKFYN